jgi:hypothetical protein
MMWALMAWTVTAVAAPQPAYELERVAAAAEAVVREVLNLPPEHRPPALDRPLAMAAPVPRVIHEAPPDKNRWGIRLMRDNTYRVPERIYERYALDLKRASRLASARLHHSGGVRADGFQLSSVSRGGFLHTAGLHNGDVIHSVNGKALTGWTAALAAYRELKRSRDFTVVLTRRDGTRRRLHYRIR